MKYSKTLSFLIYGSLVVLAMGLVTSTSILSLSHILIFIPALYFLANGSYKNFSKSTWMLLAMAVAIVLSVIFNQDIAVQGYKPIGKVKYFLFGAVSIAPILWWAKFYLTDKKIRFLIYLFGAATTLASIAGIIGMNTGYNYISMRRVNFDRNAGLSGMVLNYAHNLAYFQIIFLGLIVYYKENINRYVGRNFLICIFLFNCLGIYLSYTRGAILALLIGAPFYFFKNNKMKFLIIGVLLVVFASVGYFATGKNILRPGSDDERISQWKAATMAFKERPILGYGYLNFEKYSVPIKKRYGFGQLQFGGHAHNNFLETLASTGIIGFLCFISWLVCWFAEMYKRDDLIAKISLPFIVTFIVSGFTQSTISLGVNLFFVMAAYSIGQAHVKNNS